MEGSGCRLMEANAHYNSLQVDLHGNVTRDLQMQFGYTLARAVDATDSNGSGGDLNNVTNPYVGWRYDLGPSVFDRENVAFVNFVYQIPFLKNSDNHILEVDGGRMGAVGNRYHGIGSADQSGGERQHGGQRHSKCWHVHSAG